MVSLQDGCYGDTARSSRQQHRGASASRSGPPLAYASPSLSRACYGCGWGRVASVSDYGKRSLTGAGQAEILSDVGVETDILRSTLLAYMDSEVVG